MRLIKKSEKMTKKAIREIEPDPRDFFLTFG